MLLVTEKVASGHQWSHCKPLGMCDLGPCVKTHYFPGGYDNNISVHRLNDHTDLLALKACLHPDLEQNAHIVQ